MTSTSVFASFAVKMFANKPLFSNQIFRNKFTMLVVGLILNSRVNSYGHVGMVSSPEHTFFLGKLY